MVLRVLNLHITDSTRKCWSNPDDAPHETPTEQILYRNIKVQYMNSVRIKCELLDDNLVNILDRNIEELNNDL